MSDVGSDRRSFGDARSSFRREAGAAGFTRLHNILEISSPRVMFHGYLAFDSRVDWSFLASYVEEEEAGAHEDNARVIAEVK